MSSTLPDQALPRQHPCPCPHRTPSDLATSSDLGSGQTRRHTHRIAHIYQGPGLVCIWTLANRPNRPQTQSQLAAGAAVFQGLPTCGNLESRHFRGRKTHQLKPGMLKIFRLFVKQVWVGSWGSFRLSDQLLQEICGEGSGGGQGLGSGCQGPQISPSNN